MHSCKAIRGWTAKPIYKTDGQLTVDGCAVWHGRSTNERMSQSRKPNSGDANVSLTTTKPATTTEGRVGWGAGRVLDESGSKSSATVGAWTRATPLVKCRTFLLLIGFIDSRLQIFSREHHSCLYTWRFHARAVVCLNWSFRFDWMYNVTISKCRIHNKTLLLKHVLPAKTVSEWVLA